MHSLERRLGLWDSISIVVGIILGAGIFVVPGLVARSLPQPGWILAAWAFSGLLSLLGALVFAELGAMMPETGGHYVFLRAGLGPMAAFLCGWTYFLIVQPSVVAYLSVSFARYLAYFVPGAKAWGTAIALGLIFTLCAANRYGTRWGARIQNFFTAMKLAGLGILILSALLVPASASAPVAPPADLTPGAFGVAMIACLLSFEGWAYLSFVNGEIEHPERNIVRALGWGLVICTAIYLLVNVAYLRLLAIPEFIAADRPGSIVAERALGPGGGVLVTLTILVSIIGSANGQILTPARIYFAQAQDGLFFPLFARVHPRYRTPSAAILGVGLIASVLVVSGVWQSLIDFAVFAVWVFAFLVGVTLFTLRRTLPEAARPFRVPAYPWTPGLFLTIAGAFLLNTLWERPRPALVALAIIATGIPVFHVTLKRWTISSAGAPSSPPSLPPST